MLYEVITVSTVRMTVQLLLVGVFLEYLFRLNHWAINILWLLIMISVAMFSVLKNSKLQVSKVGLPVLSAFIVANMVVVIYFNYFIVQLDYIFDAKYIRITSYNVCYTKLLRFFPNS